MQTIKIAMLIAALDKLNGRWGIFDKGTTIRFITHHTNTPYRIPVMILLFAKKFSLGNNKKKIQ